MIQDLTAEIQKKVENERLEDQKQMILSMSGLENEHLRLNNIINNLNSQLDIKKLQIDGLLKEIAEMRVQIFSLSEKLNNKQEKHKKLKEKHLNLISFGMVDKEVLHKFYNPNIPDSEIIPYTVCLAAALEDFLI